MEVEMVMVMVMGGMCRVERRKESKCERDRFDRFDCFNRTVHEPFD